MLKNCDALHHELQEIHTLCIHYADAACIIFVQLQSEHLVQCIHACACRVRVIHVCLGLNNLLHG